MSQPDSQDKMLKNPGGSGRDQPSAPESGPDAVLKNSGASGPCHPSASDSGLEMNRRRVRRQQAEARGLEDSWFWAGILAVLVLAVALRFPGVEKDSYWLDELYTLWVAESPDFSTLLARTEEDVHPPLHYAMAWSLLRLGVQPETSLRWLSAGIGVLGVLAIGWLGRCLFGARVGLGAAALLAVNPFHVYMSGEARSYALVSLLGSLSFGALLLARQQPARRGWLGLHALSSAALLYSHYFGSVLLACQVVAIVPWRREQRPFFFRALGSFLLCSLLYAPWIRPQLDDLKRAEFWIPHPQWSAFLELGSVWWTVWPGLWVLVGWLFLWGCRAARRPSGRLGSLLLWACGPLALAFLKSQLGASVWTPRNLLIALPGWTLLLGLGWASLRWAWLRWSVLGLGLVGFVLAPRQPGAPGLGVRGQMDLRGASAWVARVNQQDRHPVYLHEHGFVLGWYLTRFQAPGWSGQNLPMTPEALPPIFWLVEAHGILPPRQAEALNATHKAVIQRGFGACRVSLYVLPDQPGFDAFTGLELDQAPGFRRPPRAPSLADWLGSRQPRETLLLVSTDRFWRFLTTREKRVLQGFLGDELAGKLEGPVRLVLRIGPQGQVQAQAGLQGVQRLQARLPGAEPETEVLLESGTEARPAKLRIGGVEVALMPAGLMGVRLGQSGDIQQFWGLDTRSQKVLRASLQRVDP